MMKYSRPINLIKQRITELQTHKDRLRDHLDSFLNTDGERTPETGPMRSRIRSEYEKFVACQIRAHLVAYGLLRGLSYSKIEPKANGKRMLVKWVKWVIGDALRDYHELVKEWPLERVESLILNDVDLPEELIKAETLKETPKKSPGLAKAVRGLYRVNVQCSDPVVTCSIEEAIKGIRDASVILNQKADALEELCRLFPGGVRTGYHHRSQICCSQSVNGLVTNFDIDSNEVWIYSMTIGKMRVYSDPPSFKILNDNSIPHLGWQDDLRKFGIPESMINSIRVYLDEKLHDTYKLATVNSCTKFLPTILT